MVTRRSRRSYSCLALSLYILLLVSALLYLSLLLAKFLITGRVTLTIGLDHL